MVIVRRTFFCKLGQAGPVVALCKELVRIIKEADATQGAQRVYTDLSGQTDRVILESELVALVHPRELSARIHAHPAAPRVLEQLGAHLEHADTEFLMLEVSA